MHLLIKEILRVGIAFFFSILPAYNIAFGSAWVPEPGEYIFSANIERTLSLSKFALRDYETYQKKCGEIYNAIIARYNLTLKTQDINLPQSVIESRKREIDSYIEHLKRELGKIRIYYPVHSTHYSIEKGIVEKLSFGSNISKGSYASFFGDVKDHSSAELFFKRNLYQTEKNIISGTIGAFAMTGGKYISCNLGLYTATIRTVRKKIKIIHALQVKYTLDKKINIFCTLSIGFEHINSGFSITCESTAGHNMMVDPAYTHYYKDQLKLAKTLQNYTIPFVQKVNISLGWYNDYYTKSRKPHGSGFAFGIWAAM